MPKKDKSLHPRNNENKLLLLVRNVLHGKPPQLVKSKPIKGNLTPENKRKITIAIKTIAEECSSFKLGASGDLYVRAEKTDYRKDFDFIKEIFCSTSEQRIIDFEVELIKKFMKLYPEKNLNKHTARAGKLTTYDGYYRIYVVYN